jgi:hypothetical protein
MFFKFPIPVSVGMYLSAKEETTKTEVERNNSKRSLPVDVIFI